MKFNFVKTIIAIFISALISYGFYNFHSGNSKDLLSGGSFIFLTLTLIGSIGIIFEQSRVTTNFRTVSVIFFLIALVSNIVFSFFQFITPIYFLTNGLLFFVFVLIAYSISRAQQ